MASLQPAKLKESYVELCRVKSLEPNAYIIGKLDSLINDTMALIIGDLVLDLSGNKTLRSAERVGCLVTYFGNERLTDVDAQVFLPLLSKFNDFASLDLRYNNLTDKSASAIAHLLKSSSSLKDLNIMCNEFTDLGIKKIAKALQQNKTLENFRLNGNKFGDKGGMYIAEAIKANNSLQLLDLGDCNLEIDSVIAVGMFMWSNSSIRSLVLNRPLIRSQQEEAAVHMCRMLQLNSTLVELHLEKFSLRDFGVERLCDGLYKNRSLLHLNISNNRLSRDGAMPLARLLCHDTPLTSLDVSRNRLESAGLRELAAALATRNRKLRSLDVRCNESGGDGLFALASATLVNTNLTHLYIMGNTVSERAADAFGQLMLAKRFNERHIDFRPFLVDGRVQLAELANVPKRFYYMRPTHGPDIHSYQCPAVHPCRV